jgi:hypothetical protein
MKRRKGSFLDFSPDHPGFSYQTPSWMSMAIEKIFYFE